MKKIIGLITITFLIFMIITVSCKKQDPEMFSEKFINPMEFTGQKHNNDLQYILENLKEIPSNNNVRSVVEHLLSKKYYTTHKSTNSLLTLPEFPDDIDDLDVYSWVENFSISDNLKKEIRKTFDFYQSEPGLEQIFENIEAREKVAHNLFEGKELKLYYEHLAVAKYSPLFWLPEDQGGLNGLKYLSNLKKSIAGDKPKIDLWKVFACDCTGGIVGGPAGYVGASVISTVMQL